MQSRGSREDRPRRDRDRYGEPRDAIDSAPPEPAAAPQPAAAEPTEA
jgi:hypothetical protein